MSTICIIKGSKPELSETFLAAHVERLKGNSVVLYNFFPRYTYNGRTIRYFYSRHPFVSKAKRILPQFLYDRWLPSTKHPMRERWTS